MKKIIEVTRLDPKQFHRLFTIFTKVELRAFAKRIGIPLGESKGCTLYNLQKGKDKLKGKKITIIIEE